MTDDMQQDAAPAAEPIEQAEQTPLAEQTPEQSAEPQPEPKAEAPKRRTAREALEKAFAEESPKPDAEAEQKADQPETDGRPRTPDGKFAPKEAAEASQEAKRPEADPKPVAEQKPISEPPSRFSADAKAAWKDAPESVRGEINRAVKELESGLQQYQQAVEPLKPYMDMARQHGTTVHDALGNYVRMEQGLRNPETRPQALRALAQNMGMTPADMAAMLTGQQVQGDNVKDREILALRQEIHGLKEQFGQLDSTVTQSREQAVLQDVQKFAADRPRFEELSDEILRMLQTGYASDLADAYEKADRLNPAPQPAAPPPPAPTPQPRQPRSLTGAPSPGSNPATQRTPSKSPREALERAFRG